MDLDLIEKRLKEVKLPPIIILDKASTITNVEKFFVSHLAVLRSETTSNRIKKLHADRVRIASAAIKKFNQK